jgi:hypothetical protein
MAESEKQPEAMQEASANPNADAPAKNAVPAEPSHLDTDYEDLGSPVVKPTDSNPDATKKVTKASDEVSKSAQVAAEPTHLAKAEEVEDDSEDKENISEKTKAEDKEKNVEEEEVEVKAKDKKAEIDVKEDVEALVGDSDLSDEFKQKAATIFEAAIKSKVKAESERLQAEYDKKFEEEIEKSKSALSEKVDSYLSYVVEEWMKDNQLALERGIKGEIAEDFIAGLKKLFEDHYIDVPDEKYDVLEDQASKIEDLEKKLNEEIEKNVDMNKVNSGFKRQEIIDEHSKDLADTAKEKFDKLVEDVEYSSEEDFATKVKTIKESYFEQKSEGTPKEGDIDNVAEGGETSSEDLTNAMAAYTNAISKTKDKIKIV